MSLLDHAPVLVVVLPLLTAPIIALLRSARVAGIATFVVAALDAALAFVLFTRTLDGSVISYAMGGWAPPIGIEYRIDLLSAVMACLTSFSAALVAWLLPVSIAPEVTPGDRPRLFAAFLLCLAGLTGMVVTGDLFNVFVFLEISSLATYVLIAAGAGRDRRALTAAFDYLILGAVGATFIVIGIAFLYVVTGTLNMADLGNRLPLAGKRAGVVGASFLFVGLALKTAMMPLHRWLPNAYTFAPAAVTAFLAMTATKVALYLMIRLAVLVFGTPDEIGRINFATVLPPIGLVMLIAGSALAVVSADLKRLLAFSSIANLGLMLVALGLGGAAGIAAALVNLINHAVIKGGMFATVAGIVHRRGSSRMDSLAGLSREMPFAFVFLMIGGMGLIGVPLTAGFVSKLLVVKTAFDLGQTVVAAGVLLSSLISVVYVWRIVEACMIAKPAKPGRRHDVHPIFAGPMALLGVGTLALGIEGGPLLEVATRVAAALTGGAS